MLDYTDDLLDGLATTLQLVAASWGGAVVLAVVLVSCRVSTVPLARGIAAAIVHTAQAVPLLLWLVLAGTALPVLGVTLSPWTRAAVTLACYTAVYYAEAVRSGINAIPPGQTDAARALGMRSVQILGQVVIPQGLMAVLPLLGTLTIGLLLNTSLVGAVGVLDLTAVAQQIAYDTADPVLAFGTTSCVYAALAVVITAVNRQIVTRVKRRSATLGTSGPPGPVTVGFDEPGPRGRRRIQAATAVGVAALLAAAVLAGQALLAAGAFDPAAWSLYGRWPIWRFLLEGAAGTASAGVLAIAVAILPGTALSLVAAHHRPWVRKTAAVVVDAVLTVPLLLWLYAAILILPAAGFDLSLTWQVVVPLAITAAAGTARILSDSIGAIDAGQREGALALGLRQGPALRLVVLPQAVRHAVPALVGQLTRTIKDTTLGLLVGLPELLGQARALVGYSSRVGVPYLVAAGLFAAVTGALTLLANQLKRRGQNGTHIRARATPGSDLRIQLA